ncbi:MAG: 3-deoxy-manno-octulosonate cytidylyltransferase [Bdellovibrionales bacterium]|nr:3-deoxy-manno-octulosonate cytidylyltransferase [Bdellovibrionales bacterium]
MKTSKTAHSQEKELQNQSVAGVFIPVRYGSSRFPGKPLAMISGRTMLQRVVEIAVSVVGEQNVIIATDDERIASAASSLNVEVVMTPASCTNGTERIHAALQKLGRKFDIVVNFQGDAPLTPPTVLLELIQFLHATPGAHIATPAIRLSVEQSVEMEEQSRKGVVGGTFVTVSRSGRALYFSKTPIPCRLRSPSRYEAHPLMKHIGMYAFRAAALETFVHLEPTPLEQLEQLEQLRALEHDITVHVVQVELGGRELYSVDNPDDIVRVEHIIAKHGELIS